MSAAVERRNAKAAEAAITNERVTRQRVEHLEDFATAVGLHVDEVQKQIDATTHVVGQHMDFMQMPFVSRLRWLLTGKCPERKEPHEHQDPTV